MGVATIQVADDDFSFNIETYGDFEDPLFQEPLMYPLVI